MIGKIWEVGSTWYDATDDIKDTFDEVTIPAIENVKTTLLSTCRSAIGLALDNIKGNGIALVPSFTCHSVIKPFIDRGFKVFPYPIKQDLLVNKIGFIELVNKVNPSVILFHDFFGFDTLTSIENEIDVLRAKGCRVIEDMTQTMFSTYRHIGADYQLGSIRKWMPIPDGAFLSGNIEFDGMEDSELVAAKNAAMFEKHKYIMVGEGDKLSFMSKFREAEGMLDSRESTFRMSDYSIKKFAVLDKTCFSEIRRNNYICLAKRLQRHKEIDVIFDLVSDTVVPFMLPVLIRSGRVEFQKFMAQHNVYPTIIWSRPDEIKNLLDDDAKFIYDSILCFHCDQRYDENDMNRVGDIVDLYYKN